MNETALTPELLVQAYCVGAFPMATGREGTVQWMTADPRAILPLEPGVMRVPRSLGKRLRQRRYHITHDRAFEAVIGACALPRPDSDETWINSAIHDAYIELHRMGVAHSVEAWLPGELMSAMAIPGVAAEGVPTTELPERRELRLAGGLYGVALGGAFFGESMFSRAADASKVCLVHLVEHLRTRGYTLLDVQFTNPHLEQFGIVEISRARYMRRLKSALEQAVDW